MSKGRLLGSSALGSLLATGLVAVSPSIATAQQATGEWQEDTPGESIVVTGSRIARKSVLESSDPVSVIDPGLARKAGRFDLADTLQSHPVAAGSTQVTSVISSNLVTNGGPGAETIDLRGLGPNRTLVLLNGRRVGPAGTRGGVSSFDLNVLPQSIISRIEIVKTGASSVYGSDAIAGVVNIETAEQEGFVVTTDAGMPTRSGGEEYRISASWGRKFERGHLLLAADYGRKEELTRGDRSYLGCPEDYIFRPDGTRADLTDPRTGAYRCDDLPWGHVWAYNSLFATDASGNVTDPGNLFLDGAAGPNSGANTSPGGGPVLLQYQNVGESLGIPAFGTAAYAGDFAAPEGWYPTGYDAQSLAVQNEFHPFMQSQTIIPQTETYTGFAEASYELSDRVEAFGEFLFNRRETYQNSWRQFWTFGVPLSLTGGDSNGTIWADGFTGINILSPTGITDHADSSQTVDYYRGVGGLRGGSGAADDWHWEVYGQYSRSIGRYRTERILQDAIDSGYFQTESCAGTVLPVSGRECIDLPWTDPDFLAGNFTREQEAFLFGWEEGRTLYSQLSGEATLSGTLAELPAGALGFALGATWRRDRIEDVPGEITLAGNAWNASTSGVTAGRSDTSEAYAELYMPILSGVPLFEELALSAAGRVTNVDAVRKSDGVSDSDNGNVTYKIGANWAPNGWLRLRGSYGTSFRAPALFEQFLADETGFARQADIDPCIGWSSALAAGTITQRIADNCAADGLPGGYAGGADTAVTIASGGLGELKPETSRALTAGIVLTPRIAMLPHTDVTVTLDYFDIRLHNGITRVGAGNILYGCYDSADFPNDPLCSLFSRGGIVGAPDSVSEVEDGYLNIAGRRNSGVDLSVQLLQDMGELGRLSFTADMTWQTRDTRRLLPGSPAISNNGEAGSPVWVGDFRLGWQTPVEGLSLFYGANVIGATSDEGDFRARNGGEDCVESTVYGTYCPDLTAPAIAYHSVSLTKEFNNGVSLTVGMSNVFDTKPPRVSVLNGGTISMIGPTIAASQYDYVGRKGFLSLTARF